MSLAQSLSTEAYDAKPVRISKNISFRSAYPGEVGDSGRPLALVFAWLMSKSKHIHKYGDFYLGKDFDVVHVRIDPLELMWPRKAQKVIYQLTDFISDSNHASKPILIHGFSIGVYLYGEMLVHMANQGQKGVELRKRIAGQIFDSPGDSNNIPEGVSRAVVTSSPAIQKAMQFSLDAYLKTFPKKVTCHYEASSQQIHENNMKVPALFLYSKVDPVGAPGPIEAVIDKWRASGISVDGKCWPDSPHVSHFHYYPVEYITELNMFLEKIGLTVPQLQQPGINKQMV